MSRLGIVSLALLFVVSVLLLASMHTANAYEENLPGGVTTLLGGAAALAAGWEWRRRRARKARRIEGPSGGQPDAAPDAVLRETSGDAPGRDIATAPAGSNAARARRAKAPKPAAAPPAEAAHRVTAIHATFDAYRRALEGDEFTLHYQPRVRLADGEVTGFEALLRRIRDEGSEGTAALVEQAEKSAFGPRLGEWILRTAARQSLAWRQSGVSVPIAVNISPSQFCDPGFLRVLGDLIASDPALPAHLELELAEAALTLYGDGATQTLRELAAMGFGVQVDQFGTAASSLHRLGQGPVRALKIDRSLVLAAPADAEAGRIVRASVALAQAMELKVIAVGVETAEQYRFLQSWGCHEAQGYLFMPPMAPAKALQVWRGHGPG